ncbi:UDP-N-acetyl-D-mannosamine dehydrogenase [Aeromicrobium flavum]|uniref:UDP-N-acetyl-D-mannosamine dehydrogenase n=1 Tax=Aeromicrobium flavum TaxID=416568 RepID=UPI001FE309B3|nr:UDP-N-acetyl-D-mannosamine dehydrogenase [Aeromicrobium flavum]
MHICVVGLGYIGLPTGVVLAQAGQKVTGVDKNPEVVAQVSRGELHFVEPGMEEALERVVTDGLLTASQDPVAADVFVVAVPTPFRDGHQPDLSYIEDASRAIAQVLSGGELVILESTSPPGTTAAMRDWIASERPDLDIDSIDFAHGPERVLPGRILIELVQNDRIVGGLTPRATQRAAEVYRTFCAGSVLETDARTAEAVKLVENSYRDVNIAFANELSLIADRIGVDVWEVIELANHHPRVNVLNPGPGVGGHCIAVDPWFLAHVAPDLARLITTARHVNDDKPQHVLDLIRRADLADGSTIALLGLAFKSNVDDLRGSPAIAIAQSVAETFPGSTVVAVEPFVDELPPVLRDAGIDLVDIDRAVDADLVVLLVDHDVFVDVPQRLADHTVVVDTRGQWRRPRS